MRIKELATNTTPGTLTNTLSCVSTPTAQRTSASADALLMLSRAEAAPVSDPEGSRVDASALGAAVSANASALELLAGAAEAGNTEAMNFLGVLYASGSQVPRDYPMALYWFQKATYESEAVGEVRARVMGSVSRGQFAGLLRAIYARARACASWGTIRSRVEGSIDCAKNSYGWTSSNEFRGTVRASVRTRHGVRGFNYATDYQ